MSHITSTPEAVSTSNVHLARHRIQSLPIVVLFPHSRCNCRCVMCDIWRIRQIREITAADLETHLEAFRALQVRWVVLSGGEPQLHSDLHRLCKLLRAEGIQVTLLTAGLLLEGHAESVASSVDDIIVSLDGPPEIHDRIRGVPRAYKRMQRGIQAIRATNTGFSIRARSTVQKANSCHLRATVGSARELGCDSISFVAVDASSTAFNRPAGWTIDEQSAVMMTAAEVDRLEAEVEALIAQAASEIASGFIVEDETKLRRIVQHFRAYIGQATPQAPPCNAPWVSAVIESDGAVRPCFFHPPYGNVRDRPLLDILNSPRALAFRNHLDIAANPVCQNCVCSLNLPPEEDSGPSNSL